MTASENNHCTLCDKPMADAQREKSDVCPTCTHVGKKVRLTRDVDRYPNFVAKKGSTGVINYWSEDDGSVKLDEPLAGAEHWDNCILWAALNGECMWDDLEEVTTCSP